MSEKCGTNPTVTYVFKSLLNQCRTISNRSPPPPKKMSKKLSKSFQKFLKSCQKSCQKVVKKMSKSCQSCKILIPFLFPLNPGSHLWINGQQSNSRRTNIENSRKSKNPKTDCKCSKIAENKDISDPLENFLLS
jgi:hypothetical protein